MAVTLTHVDIDLDHIGQTAPGFFEHHRQVLERDLRLLHDVVGGNRSIGCQPDYAAHEEQVAAAYTNRLVELPSGPVHAIGIDVLLGSHGYLLRPRESLSGSGRGP